MLKIDSNDDDVDDDEEDDDDDDGDGHVKDTKHYKFMAL
jgi:hypothetical protein